MLFALESKKVDIDLAFRRLQKLDLDLACRRWKKWSHTYNKQVALFFLFFFFGVSDFAGLHGEQSANSWPQPAGRFVDFFFFLAQLRASQNNDSSFFIGQFKGAFPLQTALPHYTERVRIWVNLWCLSCNQRALSNFCIYPQVGGWRFTLNAI